MVMRNAQSATQNERVDKMWGKKVSWVIRLSRREWSIGLGAVFGTLTLQLYMHLGPLHVYYFHNR